MDEPTQWVLRIEWDSAEGHRQGFRKSAEFGPFLAAVRPFFPDIVEMRHYEPSAVRSDAPLHAPAVPTLFEWAGGMPALERLTTEFYARVPADPLLGPIFAGMDPDHPRHVAHFLGEVFGGPTTYSAERGGHAPSSRTSNGVPGSR